MKNLLGQLEKLLDGASRFGAEKDEPEGARFIQISDTMARKLARAIHQYALPAEKKFAVRLPIMRHIAREHGYALGVHGSQVRDLDVIAAPWTAEASSADALVKAICAAIDGFIVNDFAGDPYDMRNRSPESKPHGRLAWSIQIGGDFYIDLSVMPRMRGRRKYAGTDARQTAR